MTAAPRTRRTIRQTFPPRPVQPAGSLPKGMCPCRRYDAVRDGLCAPCLRAEAVAAGVLSHGGHWIVAEIEVAS